MDQQHPDMAPVAVDGEAPARPAAETAGGEDGPDGLPAFSADGVDLRQVRWFLSLTPEQRLQTLQNFVDFVIEARNARASGRVR